MAGMLLELFPTNFIAFFLAVLALLEALVKTKSPWILALQLRYVPNF